VFLHLTQTSQKKYDSLLPYVEKHAKLAAWFISKQHNVRDPQFQPVPQSFNLQPHVATFDKVKQFVNEITVYIHDDGQEIKKFGINKDGDRQPIAELDCTRDIGVLLVHDAQSKGLDLRYFQPQFGQSILFVFFSSERDIESCMNIDQAGRVHAQI
jgi:hypothetical protein